MKRIKLAIINRSRFAREGIASSLNSEGGLLVVSDHNTVEEALQTIGEKKPDAVVIDYPDSRDCRGIIALSEFRNELTIVVSSVSLSIDCIVPCAKAGASGYIRFEASGAEWAAAIVGAVKGEIADPGIGGLLNNYLYEMQRGTHRQESKSFELETWRAPEPIEKSAKRVGLTPRERQIMALIERGLSTKHIAKQLKVCPNTVKSHISSILGKYNVHRRIEAARIFRQSEPAAI